MKWLIYFLLICNIGFAAWHFRSLDMLEDRASGALEISHENQLVLLREFQQQQTKLTKPHGEKLCYSIGPFAKKSQADKAEQLLRDNNFVTKSSNIRDSSRSGYWVILPASGSRQGAMKYIEQLKKLKIKDYFLVATGAHENAVSLGVYSNIQLARRRLDEMTQLGFIPQMESVALPQNEYWLNWYKESKDQPDESIISNIKNASPAVSKIERTCK